MSEAFTSEIRMYGSNKLSLYWAYCNHSNLLISNNDALYSLIRSTYGGDDKSTFALPNLIGRVPIHYGKSPGLTSYKLGETGGFSEVGLTSDTIPPHRHDVQTNYTNDREYVIDNPTNAYLSRSISGNTTRPFYDDPSENAQTQMAFDTFGVSGESKPHYNIQPYLVFSFIICLDGIYPKEQ